MSDITTDDRAKRKTLSTARTIAVVGQSDKPHRPSYQIAQFLRAAGYTVYPVNPTVSCMDGAPWFPTLTAIPTQGDIVNVFRRSEHLPDIVDEAIAVAAPVLWTQLGVTHPQAVQRALDAGVTTIVDRCIKIEHQRLI